MEYVERERGEEEVDGTLQVLLYRVEGRERSELASYNEACPPKVVVGGTRRLLSKVSHLVPCKVKRKRPVPRLRPVVPASGRLRLLGAESMLLMQPLPVVVSTAVLFLVVVSGAAAYPVFPPQVRASLVGHCYGFDAFNCPQMYIGRSFTSMAYFDYAGQRLREDDLFSVDGLTTSDGGINFERVYGSNINTTHIEIALFYILSNETENPLHCVKAIYAGQMNNQSFMSDAVLINPKALVHGNVTSEQWLVNAPPAYNNVYFFVGPLATRASAQKKEEEEGYSQVYRIEAADGSFFVDYYDVRATVLSDALLNPPVVADCPVVGRP